MSERLKEQLAEEMGIAHVVRTEGWGSVPSRHCGNLVRLAIQNAERALTGRPGGNGA
ncbi:MAG: small, acid-soluble spore protein, alpha/beta type [Bacillota bacterium]|jgi:small acid-soluble spore protein F (minor alpha/beta-type SASP)